MGKIINTFYKHRVLIIPITIFYSVMYIIGNRTLCIYKNLIGIPCPGCGMTRAYISLIHGDIEQAFYFHPLFILPIIIGIIILFKNSPKIYPLYQMNAFWLTLFSVFMIVWIYRMFMLFPNQSPMNIYDKGLLIRLIHFIQS